MAPRGAPGSKRRRKGPVDADGGGDAPGQAAVGPAPGAMPVAHVAEPPATPNYWLMKNEPEELSMDSLKAAPDQTAHWDGVRNYQARNFMRQMRVGDRVLFYYSSCKVPGIAGVVQVVRTAYPDFTAWDPASPYFCSKSSPDAPIWDMVDIKYERPLKRFLPLDELRVHGADGGPLSGMLLFTRFRLSVQPVSKEHWDAVLALEAADPPPEPIRPVKRKPKKSATASTRGKTKQRMRAASSDDGGDNDEDEDVAPASD